MAKSWDILRFLVEKGADVNFAFKGMLNIVRQIR
jgi:hypothetical protein